MNQDTRIKLDINFLKPTDSSTPEDDIDLLVQFYCVFSDIGIKNIKKANSVLQFEEL